MKFDQATLKARFHEAKAEKEAAESSIAPLVAQRDALMAQMRPIEAQISAIDAQLKAAREPIYELSCEMGKIAKFLAGADGKARLG